MDYKSLGKNIKKLRLMAGLKQSDLAEKCNCSDSHIGQIERSDSIPSLDMVIRIANALNVSVDQLVCNNLKYPERVYLKEISERLDQYSLEKRIVACRSLIKYLNMLEEFGKLD